MKLSCRTIEFHSLMCVKYHVIVIIFIFIVCNMHWTVICVNVTWILWICNCFNAFIIINECIMQSATENPSFFWVLVFDILIAAWNLNGIHLFRFFCQKFKYVEYIVPLRNFTISAKIQYLHSNSTNWFIIIYHSHGQCTWGRMWKTFMLE